MAKAKVILKEKKESTAGLEYESKDKGELNVCISMAVGYVADYVVDGVISVKEVTQTLKSMIKEETERRGNGTWL